MACLRAEPLAACCVWVLTRGAAGSPAGAVDVGAVDVGAVDVGAEGGGSLGGAVDRAP